MGNTLIYGKSGCGKTTGYMFNKIKEMVENKENLLIIDRKAEYYKTFGQELRNKNYNVLLLNFNSPQKSNGFNILLLPYQLYTNNEKDLSIRMLNSIYKEILYCKDYEGDSFWINSAANYLVGITLLLFANGKEEEINIGSVYTLIMEYERKSFEKIKSYLDVLSVTNGLYTYLSGTVLAPVDTRGGVMATIKERLCLYIGSDNILKLLCTNDIKLTNLDKPYALFIYDNDDYASLTNVLIDEFSLFMKNYNLIIDNADNLGKIERLEMLLDNHLINKVKTYFISYKKENIELKYGKGILDKFNKIIDYNNNNDEFKKIGNYNDFPSLENKKQAYINPLSIKFN